MDFKVGDFVRFKASIFRKNEWLELKNYIEYQTGIISKIDHSPWGDSYEIEIITVDGDKEYIRIAFQTLEHARIRANKLTRKLYPNNDEEEGWIYL